MFLVNKFIGFNGNIFNRFSEEKVKLYSAEIILAIEHLNMKNIVFRDLEPENVLLDTEGHVAITYFGLSKEGVLDWTRGTNSFVDP